MKKFLMLFLTVAAFVLYGSAMDRDFTLGHVKIPVYQKGKLEIIIFADSGKRQGLLISGKNTLIDRLIPGVDVDRIPDGWKAQIYQLGSPLGQILKFWEKRYSSSEAVIFTPLCNFDRKNNLIYGADSVFMRTPAFDLDGIGFRSNLNSREIEISSDVRIIARRDDSDPGEILSGKLKIPAEYNTVSASGDSLRLDMEHTELMLIGNVKVVDGTTVLTCDRLTIFMKSKEQQRSARKVPGNQAVGDSSSMLKGISRILADGDVKLLRRPESAGTANAVQTAKCEHLEYEFDTGRIILTGDDTLPTLSQDNHTLAGERIELLRFSRKAFVTGKCRISETATANGKTQIIRTISADRADFDAVENLNIFTGNVVVVDNDAVLNCRRMRVFLKAVNAVPASSQKSPEFSPLSGNQELDRIFCDGDVKIVSRIKPGASPKAPPPQPSTIISQRCELDYPANKLVFYEKIRVSHKGDTLDCDRLDLFLKDSAFNSKPGSSAPQGIALGGRSATGKTLQKVIASGKVYMKDQESDLSTELLTLDFVELKPGTTAASGMFTASNVQLVRITCDGAVVARSLPQLKNNSSARKRVLKAEHAMSDMVKHRTEFHKNVRLSEAENEIICQDMFVFTGPAPQPAEPERKTARPEDPDADPFAIEIENVAPSRIALSDGIDLQRIICKNNVVLINRDRKGSETHAGGDMAVYTVSTSDIVITAEPPKRPYLKRDGRRQYSDIIRGNLKTELLEGSGNVQVVTDEAE